MDANIYIIGAGAIGQALAVFLTNTGKNVFLIRGRGDAIEENAVSVKVELQGGIAIKTMLTIKPLNHFTNLDGIILITGKSYGNEDLSRRLKGKTGRSPIVLLQNGLFIEESFITNTECEIYRCVLFVTSQFTAENVIRFRPAGPCPVGVIRGGAGRLAHIVGQLKETGFCFTESAEIQLVIWRKAIVNVVFNSICPLLETDNGVFCRNAFLMRTAERVAGECVAVAHRMGVAVNQDEILSDILRISRVSDGQLISTLQDIRRKQKTEIETLNFAIADMAARLGEESLTRETKLLGELTKIKSELACS